MTIPPLPFVPSTDAAARPAVGPAGARWFAFRGRALLVGADAAPPLAPSLEALGLAPVRVQFVGQRGDEPCFSAELPADVVAPPGMTFEDLRPLFFRMEPGLHAIAGRAVQLVEWDRTHQFCGACGGPTALQAGAIARLCPRCGLAQHPRVSPAMIVAVERGDELLLARGPHFPPGIFSVLAGFVDAGESAEEAVHREVREEAGVRVRNVRYFGSQPWPFPHSLMLGFQADWDGGEVVPAPGEIEAAGFFRADALPPLFPGRISISQWLIHDFLRRRGVARPG